MVLAEDLRQAVLQMAIQGKLVEQIETDKSVDDYLIQILDRKAILIKNKEIKKEPTLSDVKNEDIQFEIPENWRWVKLGNLCSKIGAGSTPKGGAVNYVTEGVPFIREQNVYSSGLLYSGMAYITKELNEAKAGSMVKPNDLLLNITGGSIGRCAMTPNDFVTGNVNQHVLIIRFVDVTIVEYLHTVINSPYIQRQIREKSKGDKEGLSATSTKNFLIPLPPIEEQQRIVDKINEIMPKINEYEKIEKELEVLKKEFPTDMKDALLQAAIQGKLTKQLESDSSVDKFLKNQGVNILDDEDYPYVIPINWRFVELGDLTSIPIKRGKSPKYTDKSGILVFAQKCNQKIGKISLEDAKYLDENIKHKYEQENYLQGNDIVINSTGGGTLGRIGYISEELIKHSLPIVPDSHVTTIRTKDNVLPRYIYFFLKFNQSYLETLGVGSTNQTELRPDTIKELLVPLPPIEEQQRIVEKLDALLPLCEDLKEK